MYILIKDSIPPGIATVAAAHASLAAYVRFKNTPEVQNWLAGPFYKIVCQVNDREFERAKLVADHVVLTESTLGDQEVALAFKPREDWPKLFQFYKLYR